MRNGCKLNRMTEANDRPSNQQIIEMATGEMAIDANALFNGIEVMKMLNAKTENIKHQLLGVFNDKICSFDENIEAGEKMSVALLRELTAEMIEEIRQVV